MKLTFLRFLKVILGCIIVYAARADADVPESPQKPYSYTELVLSPHAILTVKTETGTMEIEALDALTRKYTWEGASRSIRLTPRETRWQGSLGAYSPGEGEGWENHKGITRAVLNEGQLNYASESEALKWLHLGMNHLMVYRDDGLAVMWSKDLDRHQLNVDVWQILINGKKPTQLSGSQNDKITLKGDSEPPTK